MNLFCVITTINSPTKGIKKIAALAKQKNVKLVVVGDRKTKPDWSYENVTYLNVMDQSEAFPEFSTLVPNDHYCRKNLGYLFAIRHGAQIIIETDDDNIPEDNFFDHSLNVDKVEMVGTHRWINVYKHFSNEKIWPRGNPLNETENLGETVDWVSEDFPIQQYLADGDPDVDAVYRMLNKTALTFERRQPLCLANESWCSFNSQNTFFHKSFFPCLYLPGFVSFRMTDIWRSFVAQFVLKSQRKKMLFGNATVFQERNKHDLIEDFKQEIDGYVNNNAIIEHLNAKLLDISQNGKVINVIEATKIGWETIHGMGLICSNEMNMIMRWLAFFENKD